VADLTHLWTEEGWLYLAVVLDLYSRAVVGCAMAGRMTRDLVIDALTLAIWRRRPAPGLIVHSDRGSQYASRDYQQVLEKRGFLYKGVNTGEARKTCTPMLWKIAARKLDQLDSATSVKDLRFPPGNHLEALAGDRRGQHSIRIDDRFQICFAWTEAGPDEVEIVDYH
jgi:proteic killer suppression protein